jgi:hypothetical protein
MNELTTVSESVLHQGFSDLAAYSNHFKRFKESWNPGHIPGQLHDNLWGWEPGIFKASRWFQSTAKFKKYFDFH